VLNATNSDNDPMARAPEDAICRFQRTRSEYIEIGSFLPEK
jgi:hypothetical protein